MRSNAKKSFKFHQVCRGQMRSVNFKYVFALIVLGILIAPGHMIHAYHMFFRTVMKQSSNALNNLAKQAENFAKE